MGAINGILMGVYAVVIGPSESDFVLAKLQVSGQRH